jgi:hypothetical protein
METPEINIEKGTKIKHRIKLVVDSTRAEVERKAKTAIWVPSHRLWVIQSYNKEKDDTKLVINSEISPNSTISVFIKEDTRVVFLKKHEVEIAFSGKEVHKAFWESKNSISSTKF